MGGVVVNKQAIRVLGASAVPVSTTGDTVENTLATVTIPAGAMGLNGIIRVTATWAYTNSANTKTLRARFSGAAGTVFMNLAPTTSASAREQRQFANSNSVSSQRYQIAAGGNATGGWGTGTGAILTTSVDTSATTTIVFTGQNGLGSETITLDSYLVELLLP